MAKKLCEYRVNEAVVLEAISPRGKGLFDLAKVKINIGDGLKTFEMELSNRDWLNFAHQLREGVVGHIKDMNNGIK